MREKVRENANERCMQGAFKKTNRKQKKGIKRGEDKSHHDDCDCDVVLSSSERDVLFTRSLRKSDSRFGKKER